MGDPGGGVNDQEPLAEYRAKRHFHATPEPAGRPPEPSTPPADGRRFVVQRHRATRLHYDLRLEMDGVLVSWAVPKGPSLDPSARRLAVHVEDHPLEYFDFEGVIPKGEYGGGDVIVWDWGTWTPAPGTGDPAAAVAAGELHADLRGEKLAGRFVFIRRGRRAAAASGSSDKEQWLLFHKRDDDAVNGWDPEGHPRSVKSGRTNEEVAADPDAMWSSDAPAAEASIDLRRAVRSWEAPTHDELAALDALGAAGSWELGGTTVALTNLDKVLFPGTDAEAAVTKRDLVRYYACAAPFLLPYLADRPLNLQRFPNGVDQPGFWHKQVPDWAPEWLVRWHNPEVDPGETDCYVVADRPASLAWLANYGAIELNPWTSTVASMHQPTWAYIDIDPGPRSTFEDVLVLARLHRTAFEHLGVAAGPKVTGKRGIQIWVPVAQGWSFDQSRAWVEKLSKAIGATVPELVSWAWRKDERDGRIRLDYTQNAINRTLVAPFSARPAAGAPVSMPIRWEELDDPDLAPGRWTIRTALDRVGTEGDPLQPLIGRQQHLPEL